MTDHDPVMAAARQANPRPSGSTGPEGEWAAGELLTHIETLTQVESPRESAPDDRRDPSRRRGLLVAAAGFAVVLVVGAVLFAFVANRSDSDVVEPAPTTLPTPTTVASPTTVPTSATTPAPVAAERTVFASGPSWLISGPDGTEQESSPGAVVAHDGQWHMFGQSTPEQGGNEDAAWRATSNDGSQWIHQGPIFAAGELDIPYMERGLVISSGIVLDDGTWVLYFHTTLNDTLFTHDAGDVIGRLTAPGPEGPWTADAEPILDRGPTGAWDAAAVANPHVLQVGDAFWMYYDGLNESRDVPSAATRSIGLAMSQDGVTWTKYDDPSTAEAPFADSDPVLSSGEEGAWDNYHVYDPNVVAAAEGFVMTYAHAEPDPDNPNVFTYDYGLAHSDDGLTWSKDPINPFYDLDEEVYSWVGQSTLVAAETGYRLIANLGSHPDRAGRANDLWALDHQGPIRP